jgi:hypothetical protein
MDDLTTYKDSAYPPLSRKYGSEWDTLSNQQQFIYEEAQKAYRNTVRVNPLLHPIRHYRAAKRHDVLHIMFRELTDKMRRIEDEHNRIVRDHDVSDNAARYIRRSIEEVARVKANRVS